MKLLYLHLHGGKTLAHVLPDEMAAELLISIRERWAQPDPQSPEVAMGEGDQLTTWVRVDEIAAIELHPAEASKEDP